MNVVLAFRGPGRRVTMAVPRGSFNGAPPKAGAILVACPEKHELSSYVLGGLTGERAEQLDTHVVQCVQCADVVFDVIGQDDANRWNQQHVESPPDDIAALVRKIQEFRRSETVFENQPQQRFDSHRNTKIAERTPPPAADDYPRSQHTYFLAPPREADEIGRLAHYRICEVLGSGGMGVVFRAQDTRLDRWIALKVLKPSISGKEAKHRFRREARAAASLDHEHVVSIYEVGEEGQLAYLAMQLLRGESLHDRLQRIGVCPPRQILRIGREVAEGLAAAHQKNLIHRDIKPDNIWLEADGDRVKILDFGLARVSDDANLTQSGSVLGTPRYMSPEQASGVRVDKRSDLFSLGSVLYHMAIGEPPFKKPGVSSTLVAVIQEDPIPPHELQPAISQPLSRLIMQLLEKDPQKRPASAEEVIGRFRELERLSHMTVAELGALHQPDAASRRPMLAVSPFALLAGLVLAAALISAAFLGPYWKSASNDTAAATTESPTPPPLHVAPKPARETKAPPPAEHETAAHELRLADFPQANIQAAIQTIVDKIVAAMQQRGEAELAMGSIDPSQDNAILKELLLKTLERASIEKNGNPIPISVDSFADWRITGDFSFPPTKSGQRLLLSFELKDENGAQVSLFDEVVRGNFND